MLGRNLTDFKLIPIRSKLSNEFAMFGRAIETTELHREGLDLMAVGAR